MKKLILAAFAVAAVCAVPVYAAHTHTPTPSTWKLNVAESDFGGGPAMKSDTMVVTVDTEKWLKFTDASVDSTGKVTKSSWSGPQDGTMHPIVGMTGCKMSVKAADDSMHMEMPDGSKEDATFSMSSDKKKLTFVQTITMKDGKVLHQKIVYDRVK